VCSSDLILSLINQIDREKTHRVTFFAPDEASHPDYFRCLKAIADRKLITSFGSMRIDSVLKSDINFPKNMLIRVGIDGLTESTRMRVNKKIKNIDIINYFRQMTDLGHHNFKMFMIFGYEWEKLSDFNEFKMVMDTVLAIPLKVNTHLRVKFTPLIPNPITPLSDSQAKYDKQMVRQILNWFNQHKKPYKNPGWYVSSDGLMSEKNHQIQCLLSKGDSNIIDKI